MRLKPLILFPLAGALMAQTKNPQPFHEILEAFDQQATFSVDRNFKRPLDAADPPSTYTVFGGKVQNGPQDGNTYQAQCYDDNCGFLLEDRSGGQSTIQRIGKTIFIVSDMERNVVSASSKGQSRVFLEIINPEDQVAASTCYLEPQTEYVKGETGPEPRTVIAIGKCVPMEPSDAVPPAKARDIADELQDLCADRPSGFPGGPDVTQQYVEAANSYLSKEKSRFGEVLDLIRKKLHLKSAEEFSLR